LVVKNGKKKRDSRESLVPKRGAYLRVGGTCRGSSVLNKNKI